MINVPGLEPIDYLVVGHLTQDLTPQGPRLGGAAAYAALTARALGLRAGIVTSWAEEEDADRLAQIPVINLPAECSTTFENRHAGNGRAQTIHHVAETLDLHLIPETWRRASIVHLAPVAREVSPTLVRHFPQALLGLTPQGWLREWDDEGRVRLGEWPESVFVLQQADAAVLSVEDLGGEQRRIEDIASSCSLLVVTEGARGAHLYTGGEVTHFQGHPVDEVDPTGAGDIFAAAFFIRLYASRDAHDAANFANRVAALSVTRRGLDGVPSKDEVYDLMSEVR